MAQVGIFVGTVYGNSLLVAEEAESILKEQGHEVKVFDEGTLEAWQYYRQHYALVVTSTTGQGDFPDSIASLFIAVRDQVGFQPELRDAPRDKCAHFREINGIAAAFQYLQKNYIPTALSFH